MKTAIIKTGFWLDDDVFELNSDTKLVYLCLLTNPQRDLLPAFRCSDRMLSTYTGYNKDLIDTCRKQLIAAGRIYYEEGFYIFTTQDFVKPSAGRDSSKIYQREYKKLPPSVKEIVKNLHRKSTGSSTGTGTGTSTGHIYINKHININKDKEISTEKKIDENALRLAEKLSKLLQYNFEFIKHDPKAIKKWAVDIDKINRIDGQDWYIIEAVIDWCQNDNFWKGNIRSGDKLRKQFETLMIHAKIQHDNSRSKVTEI